MDEYESLWAQIQNEAELQEVQEIGGFDYAGDWISQGHQFTLNRIISNQTGGKKSVPY
jgi:hypothetical protein